MFRKRRIDNDSELYQRYWSEFVEYYIANGLSLTSVRDDREKPNYHFHMDNFKHYHIDLGVFLLGDSEISANVNLNKQITQNRNIFEALRSAQDIFQRDFDEELLFLPDRSTRVYIIGCKTQADQRNPNDWSNQFEWLCTNIEQLNKVFLGPLKVTQYYEQTRLPQ